MPRHYAPRTPLRIVSDLRHVLQETLPQPFSLLVFGSDERIPIGTEIAQTILMPRDPPSYAAMLYDALHDLDEAGLALILVEAVPEGDEWLAIRDRLSRAATP